MNLKEKVLFNNLCVDVENLHEKIDNLGTIISAIGFMVGLQFMYWLSTFII